MKKLNVLFVLLFVLLISSCSVVFEAGISGKVVTAAGTGTVSVADVSVFAYTDKADRDSDFAKFQAGTITRPSPESGYVSASTTNADGEFTVNKIVWETKKPEFGKTAAYGKLYLILYNEDYYPLKYDADIISGSANTANVYAQLERNKKYTTVNVSIVDVSTGLLMDSSVDVEYWIGNNTESDKVTFVGAGTIVLAFPKEDPSTTLKVVVSKNGSQWKFVDENGDYINVNDGVVINDIGEGSFDVSYYMKNHEFSFPSLSGRIGDNTSDISDVLNVDNVVIELYEASNPAQSVGATVTFKRQEVIAGNNAYYSHGNFAGLGGNYTWSVDSFVGPVYTDDFYLLYSLDGGTSFKKYTYTFSNIDGAAMNLGNVKYFSEDI